MVINYQIYDIIALMRLTRKRKCKTERKQDDEEYKVEKGGEYSPASV